MDIDPQELTAITAAAQAGAAAALGFHTGRDYRADIGPPVHASKAGKVVFAGAHTPAPGDDWGEAYSKPRPSPTNRPGCCPPLVVDLDDAGLAEIATAVADEQARRLQ